MLAQYTSFSLSPSVKKLAPGSRSPVVVTVTLWATAPAAAPLVPTRRRTDQQARIVVAHGRCAHEDRVAPRRRSPPGRGRRRSTAADGCARRCRGSRRGRPRSSGSCTGELMVAPTTVRGRNHATSRTTAPGRVAGEQTIAVDDRSRDALRQRPARPSRTPTRPLPRRGPQSADAQRQGHGKQDDEGERQQRASSGVGRPAVRAARRNVAVCPATTMAEASTMNGQFRRAKRPSRRSRRPRC